MINIVDGVKKYAKTDRIALICEDSELTYAQLDKYSDIIANYILNKYDEKVPVAVYGNKERLILPCMIAALKSVTTGCCKAIILAQASSNSPSFLSNIIKELFPFKYPINEETLRLGGIDTNM